MNIEDKKNHLTDKQIWLLRMLFEELGNKSLNEALQQWEQEHAKISRPTKDTFTNNRRGTGDTKDEELQSRLPVGRENTTLEVISAERALTDNRRGTRDTKDEELQSRLPVARENTTQEVISAERALTERSPEPLRSRRTKRKSRQHE